MEYLPSPAKVAKHTHPTRPYDDSPVSWFVSVGGSQHLLVVNPELLQDRDLLVSGKQACQVLLAINGRLPTSTVKLHENSDGGWSNLVDNGELERAIIKDGPHYGLTVAALGKPRILQFQALALGMIIRAVMNDPTMDLSAAMQESSINQFNALVSLARSQLAALTADQQSIRWGMDGQVGRRGLGRTTRNGWPPVHNDEAWPQKMECFTEKETTTAFVSSTPGEEMSKLPLVPLSLNSVPCSSEEIAALRDSLTMSKLDLDNAKRIERKLIAEVRTREDQIVPLEQEVARMRAALANQESDCNHKDRDLWHSKEELISVQVRVVHSEEKQDELSKQLALARSQIKVLTEQSADQSHQAGSQIELGRLRTNLEEECKAKERERCFALEEQRSLELETEQAREHMLKHEACAKHEERSLSDCAELRSEMLYSNAAAELQHSAQLEACVYHVEVHLREKEACMNHVEVRLRENDQCRSEMSNLKETVELQCSQRQQLHAHLKVEEGVAQTALRKQGLLEAELRQAECRASFLMNELQENEWTRIKAAERWTHCAERLQATLQSESVLFHQDVQYAENRIREAQQTSQSIHH